MTVIVTTPEELRAIVREAIDEALAVRRPAPSDTPPEWIDTSVAAALLGVSTRQVAKMAKAGDLPHGNVGRLLRFRRSDVLALLESR